MKDSAEVMSVRKSAYSVRDHWPLALAPEYLNKWALQRKQALGDFDVIVNKCIGVIVVLTVLFSITIVLGYIV